MANPCEVCGERDCALPETIFIDYSIFSTFQTCREKSRLSYVKSYRPIVTAPPLDFGAAWHRAQEILYGAGLDYINRRNSQGEFIHTEKTRSEFLALSSDFERAKKAFVYELQERESALPLSMESDEKRSVERGLYLLEAYVDRWKDEPYEIVRRPDTGQPYTEIGFAIYLFEWRGHPIMYVGRIDRIMRSRLTARTYNWEIKTTSQGLSVFMNQAKPNHQVTGYHLAALRMNLDVAATMWDATFVSSRKPSKGGWMAFGIDIEKDFARVETRRSQIDIDSFLSDLVDIASEYCEWRWGSFAAREWWPRSAPTACHQYGGCQYREVCQTNGNEAVIRTNFKVEVWEPWKGLVDPEKVVKI